MTDNLRECPKCNGRRRDRFGEECGACAGSGTVTAENFPLARPVRVVEERTPAEVAAVRAIVSEGIKLLDQQIKPAKTVQRSCYSCKTRTQPLPVGVSCLVCGANQ